MSLYTNPQQHGRRGLTKYEFTIATDTDNWDLDAVLAAAGYGGAGPIAVVITVNTGVRVGSLSATPGMTLPAQDTETIITLVNDGTINGQGGPGGSGNGGDALYVRHPVDLTNNGEIYGGGGGGANGAPAFHNDCAQSVVASGGAGGIGEGNSAATAGTAGQNKTGAKYASDGCDPSGTYNITGGTGQNGGTKGQAAGGAAGNWVDGHSHLNIVIAGTTYGSQTG